MRSSAVSAGNNATAAQYNALRQDAFGGAFLLPHEQASPNLTLLVEAGVCYVGATRVIFAGGNSPSFTAPAANPRIDLLTIDSAGTLARTAGTEAASPSVPAYPSDKLVIAEVYNRVGQTTVRDSDLGSNGYIKQDVRPFLGGAYIANAAQIADGIITDAKLVSTDFVKQSGAQTYAADGGASDSYAITLSPAPGSYTTGMVLQFKANTANTGAATLNVNSLGAKTIKKQKDQDLGNNDIKAGSIVEVVYDGTNFQMLNPTAVATTAIDYQVFTANGTWTKPASAGVNSRVIIELWGGGGGGGGSPANAGSGGGGGGAYNKVECLASALGSTESVTVAGTAAGGASSGATGTPGNTSSFGTKAYAYGGGGGGNTSGGSGGSGYGGGGGGILSVGGNGSSGAGGAGGAPLGGATDVASTFGGGGNNVSGGTAFTVYGGTGGSRQNAAIPANTYGGGGGGGVSAPGTAGTGGTSIFGGAGGNGANGNGANGTAPGGGGGGGGGVSGGTGGAGARGECRVTTIL
jgi:hypothetical protein